MDSKLELVAIADDVNRVKDHVTSCFSPLLRDACVFQLTPRAHVRFMPGHCGAIHFDNDRANRGSLGHSSEPRGSARVTA